LRGKRSRSKSEFREDEQPRDGESKLRVLGVYSFRERGGDGKQFDVRKNDIFTRMGLEELPRTWVTEVKESV
jgi:hypothetical protein